MLSVKDSELYRWMMGSSFPTLISTHAVALFVWFPLEKGTLLSLVLESWLGGRQCIFVEETLGRFVKSEIDNLTNETIRSSRVRSEFTDLSILRMTKVDEL